MSEQDDRDKGRRAEEVAEWYFRLNGFFLIPNFVIHPDRRSRYPRTDADLLGIRLKHTSEIVGGRPMLDDQIIIQASQNGQKSLAVLVEVKSGQCNINGPWSEIEKKNVQRALRRFGFIPTEAKLDEIAESLYTTTYWEGSSFVIRYILVGNQPSRDLAAKYRNLIQITYEEIAEFLYKRFKDFPEKFPEADDANIGWSAFGIGFARWFDGNSRDNLSLEAACKSAITKYIKTGNCNG